MKTTTAAALALTTLLAGCSSTTPKATSSSPTPTPTPSPTTSSPSATPVPEPTDEASKHCLHGWVLDSAATPAAGAKASAIVYVANPKGGFEPHDLAIWRASTGTAEQITHSRNDRCSPRFMSENEISFILGDGLWVMDLDTKLQRPLITTTQPVYSQAWNPDHTQVAFVSGPLTIDFALYVAPAAGGDAKKIYTFPKGLGRGAGYSDEIDAGWSPDGKTIAVVASGLDTSPSHHTLYVVSSSGRKLLEMTATNARWVSSTQLIVTYFSGEPPHARKTLHLVSLDGKDVELANSTGVMTDVRVGPGGTKIAYSGIDNKDNVPNVFVYDKATKKERLLGKLMYRPRWIDDHTLIVTVAKGIPASEGEGFGEAGTTKLIDITTGTATDGPISSTSEADVVY